MTMPAVILVRPESSWNIGSVARVASNFSVPQLLVVDPQEVTDADIQRTACNAPLSHSYRTVANLEEAISDMTMVVAFTARKSRHRTTHWSYPAFLKQVTTQVNQKIAFCFGPERTGLSNEDLSYCSDLVYIPTAEECPSMNLAQAVAAALFGMRLSIDTIQYTEQSSDDELATAEDWQPCFDAVDTMIAECAAEKTPPHVPGILKRLLQRSRASRYELSLLRSLLSSVARELHFRARNDSHQ